MSHSPQQILLVEDDSADADLIQRSLKGHNSQLEIVWINDGSEALTYLLSMLKTGQPLPALVIMDLKMPTLSGSEMLAEIKSVPQLANLPVAVLSSSPLEEDMTRIRELGVDEFFIKPVGWIELREEMGHILDRWQLR